MIKHRQIKERVQPIHPRHLMEAQLATIISDPTKDFIGKLVMRGPSNSRCPDLLMLVGENDFWHDVNTLPQDFLVKPFGKGDKIEISIS